MLNYEARSQKQVLPTKLISTSSPTKLMSPQANSDMTTQEQENYSIYFLKFFTFKLIILG